MRRIPWLAVSLVLGLGLAFAGCDGPSRGPSTQPSAVQGFQIIVTASPNTLPAKLEASDATAGGCALVQAKVFDRTGQLVDGALVFFTTSHCCFAGTTDVDIVAVQQPTRRGIATAPFCATDVRGTAIITAAVEDAFATTLITIF
jgi:hypothetical protein